MELVRLTAFLVATTYLPGRALAPANHRVIQTAYGLSLSLIVCALPIYAAGWVMPVVALGSIAVLVLFRARVKVASHGKSPVQLVQLLPGIIAALACLSLGPWGDVSLSSDSDAGLGLNYRTGHAVGNRSAGPRPVLPDAALVHARGERAGDPFVSGHTLPRLDPRRTYWSLAERFSGVSPYVLIGDVEPALVLLGVLFAMLVASPRASWRSGVLFFGSGFGFVFALVPAIRSWPFRIWTYLSESTGLADLLIDPVVALLLFLIVAAVASTGRVGAVLSGVAIVLCEPGMALPIVLAALVFAWRARFGLVIKLALFSVAVAGIAFSHPAPLAPMLRALEYARLDALATVVADPFAGASNTLRTVMSFAVFLVVSLGIRAFVLPKILEDASSRDDTTDRRLACCIVALGFCSVIGVGTDRAWSLGLLLMWMPVAGALADKTHGIALGRKLAWFAMCAVFVFPASINYLLHYRQSTVEKVLASDDELAQALRFRSRATDPVLHRPNRRSLSAASHLSFRPAVLCYYGRMGAYDDAELDTRSEDVRRFFETTDEAIARAVVDKYGVRWVIVEKRRPVHFEPPPWLERTTDSETWILYEVN